MVNDEVTKMETKTIIKTVLKRIDKRLTEEKETYKKLIQKLPINDLENYRSSLSFCLAVIKIYSLIKDKLESIHSDDLNYIELQLFKEITPECASRNQVGLLQCIINDMDRLKVGKRLDVIEVSI